MPSTGALTKDENACNDSWLWGNGRSMQRLPAASISATHQLPRINHGSKLKQITRKLEQNCYESTLVGDVISVDLGDGVFTR